MAGAAGYTIGDTVDLVVDPNEYLVAVEGSRESLLRELVGFCLIGAIFVATAVTMYFAWLCCTNDGQVVDLYGFA